MIIAAGAGSTFVPWNCLARVLSRCRGFLGFLAFFPGPALLSALHPHASLFAFAARHTLHRDEI